VPARRRFDPRSVQRAEVRRGQPEADDHSTGLLGDGLQGGIGPARADRRAAIHERLVVDPGRHRLVVVGVADGDRVDHHLLLAEPTQPRTPLIGEILAVGEDHDRLPLRVLFRADRFDGRVQAGAEVGAAGPDRARSEAVQRIDHGPKVLRQRTAEHPATREGHDRRAIGPLRRQGVDQLLGRLDRHGQPVGHRILGPHAPADVDEQDRVVARRTRRPQAAPPRLHHGDDQKGGRTQQPRGPVARRTATLRQCLPPAATP
jgi:hypothetical protein